MKTLNQFLAQHRPEHKRPQELAGVLESVATAWLDINAKVRLGALAGVLGMAGT
ncbi:class 1 fructose-bisphosphatase, partial [Neisseria sp. P0024.S006]